MPNYLVQAILATVFCCLPAGIVGIINASQASSKEAAGDHAGALLAAKRARQWCWIAVVGIAIAAYAVFTVAAGNGESDF
ncbi:MAG: CD225/dispanin family protein [Acidimicrobiales bacterium]